MHRCMPTRAILMYFDINAVSLIDARLSPLHCEMQPVKYDMDQPEYQKMQLFNHYAIIYAHTWV